MAKTGILLVNLGTPASPATSDVRRYLKQFLLDGRVIDIPAISRNLLVRGFIAPLRAPKSAKLYKEIWTDEGSPLLVYGERLTAKLAEELGSDFHIELAMRYQEPSIERGLEKLIAAKLDHIAVIPLFPHYASASTGSVHEEVMRLLSKRQVIPSVSFLNSYFDHPAFINAFAEVGKDFDQTAYDHVLFSYHGLPERQMRKLNVGCLESPDCCQQLTEKNHYCYKAQCYATTRALAGVLQIPEDRYTVCFQSRLGRDPWIQPYTTDVLEKLAKAGSKKLLVFCPAFVADCLETIYEISVEYQEEFEEMGGEHVQLVPSLNDNPIWVSGLATIIREFTGVEKTTSAAV